VATPIGAYAAKSDYSTVPDDIYEATITHASVVMDKDAPNIPATDKWGKNRLLVKVELDTETDDAGGPIELRRQFAISYGQTGGTYAALANLIQAVTGIKNGDKAQRNVTTEELVGKKLRVQTATVERDDKTYTNIVATFAPKKAREVALAPAPAPRASAQQVADEAALDDEIPF
jgi:hypothetical protein